MNWWFQRQPASSDKELVDFEFIYDELLDKYCLDNGRNAVPPIRMFKYLLFKSYL